MPEKRHEHLYASYFGIELIQSIRHANSRLDSWTKVNRGKDLIIPHIEANLLSGFSEGPTSYVVGEAKQEDGRWIVEVRREYLDGGTIYRWADRVLLDRDSKGWVVFDINCRYGGSVLTTIRSFERSILMSDKDDERATSQR